VRTEQEVSALGAALLAGHQAGAWTVADIKRITSPGEAVQGEPNPGAERRYRRWRELHRSARELDGVA
jgi:glycerol kinase